ncbi:MAG: class I SAM-dependent methyltransferase [Anaerolineales bacterium]|nr:class I SAM-dependent methyltransferase [Anaerolineales bacterium]
MEKHELTRWQQFYADSTNLVDISPSACANQAAQIFAGNNSRLILDLGCGTGRDSLQLAQNDATVLGVDAARSGLLLAQKRAAAAPLELSWVESDCRVLPFSNGQFDGVYCFGLLHEFVGETAVTDVQQTMSEIYRVLQDGGTAVVAVSAGDPEKGLPHVQNFSEVMFNATITQFDCLEKKIYDDLGCTGRSDYKVWFGHLKKGGRYDEK